MLVFYSIASRLSAGHGLKMRWWNDGNKNIFKRNWVYIYIYHCCCSIPGAAVVITKTARP